MKNSIFPLAFFASLGLFLSSATVSYASPSSSDEVPFCLPFDYERERGTIYAAGKPTGLDVGEPRTVRMIYFLPNDRPFRAAVIDSMKATIRQVQTFYAEQMQAHGHGNKTFRFETDAEGEPLVHRVDGQYPQIHYFDDTVGTVLDEVEQGFDIEENIYLIVADISWIAGIGVRGRRAGGVGTDRWNGGFVLFPSETALVPSERGWVVTAHELGHAFGLQHDFRDDVYIMSYGRQPNSLSICNAEFLAVHPYFNPNANTARRRRPTIELNSPQIYPTDAKSVQVQLKVSGSQGLHQAVLFARTVPPHFAAGHYEVKAWRGFAGEKEAVVTFDYDGVIPSAISTSLSEPIVHPISVYVVDTNGNYTWRFFTLWDVATVSSDIATLEHMYGVSAVAFSPDGSLIASGTVNGLTFVWDVATSEMVATLVGHTGIHAVAFSPDGTLLASGSSDGRVFVWDVETGENVETLAIHRDIARAVAFSPDGTLLAAGAGDGRVFVWDVETGENVETLVGHTDWVESVAFAPDGSLIASTSSDGTVKVWDVATGEIVETLVEHPGWWVHAVAFAPDGTLLTFDPLEGTVRVWNVATREMIETRGRFTEWSSSMVFAPDGSLIASTSFDGTVKVWDVASGGRVETLVGHTDWVQSMAFAPDGSLLASASSDGTVKVWDIPEWTQPRPQTLVKISGDHQQGPTNEPLPNPLIVEVRDQHGAPLQGIQVTFTVTRGTGTLTVDNTTTDANGRAQSALTLGPNPGTNMVLVSVTGLVAETFNALGRPPIATLINDALTDFSLFADAFGSSDLHFDLDANGTVDFADFFLFAEAADESERDQLFALAKELIGLPEGAQLYQNAPNPFNSQTVFSYFLLTPGPTRLEVFALTGQRVAALNTGPQQAGRHRLAWDGHDSEGRPLASGVYLYRLVSAEDVLTRKLILLR